MGSSYPPTPAGAAPVKSRRVGFCLSSRQEEVTGFKNWRHRHPTTHTVFSASPTLPRSPFQTLPPPHRPHHPHRFPRFAYTAPFTAQTLSAPPPSALCPPTLRRRHPPLTHRPHRPSSPPPRHLPTTLAALATARRLGPNGMNSKLLLGSPAPATCRNHNSTV